MREMLASSFKVFSDLVLTVQGTTDEYYLQWGTGGRTVMSHVRFCIFDMRKGNLSGNVEIRLREARVCNTRVSVMCQNVKDAWTNV